MDASSTLCGTYIHCIFNLESCFPILSHPLRISVAPPGMACAHRDYGLATAWAQQKYPDLEAFLRDTDPMNRKERPRSGEDTGGESIIPTPPFQEPDHDPGCPAIH